MHEGELQFTCCAQLLVPAQSTAQSDVAKQSTLPAHEFCPVQDTSQTSELHLMLP
jgi:hypothetical protein